MVCRARNHESWSGAAEQPPDPCDLQLKIKTASASASVRRRRKAI